MTDSDGMPPYVPSGTRYRWQENAILIGWYGLCIMLWCFEGEPVIIMVKWACDKLECSRRALIWGLLGAATAVGWCAYQVYTLWPALKGLDAKALEWL